MSALEAEDEDDIRLFGQVLAFVVLLLCSFSENGLGLFPGLYGSVPKVTFIVLFVIHLYHPQALPVFTVVLVGLVHDLVQVQPLGYSSGLMLVAHGWLEHRRQTLVQAETGTVWYEFTVMMGVVAVLMLSAVTLYSGHLPAIQPLAFQFGLTVLMFPVAHWVYHIMASFASMLEQMR